jgi:Golgi apyrase
MIQLASCIGLSSLADNPEAVGTYLRPLLSHARNHIPPSLQKDTPLFLLATAGMRLLSPNKQAEILLETCRFLVTHSNFKIEAESSVGPCGASVRIITGEEEGLFGWIAVNYLMNGFSGSNDARTTYGFLDMGGASTQIAFEPSPENQKEANNLVDVRLRLLGGEEIHHKVFVTTWLGYGTNQARERYVGQAITEFDSKLHNDDDDDDDEDDEHHLVPDPCLPKNLELKELPVHSSDPATAHLKKSHRMIGTGSFEQCIKKTATLLNTSTPCPDTPCLMNGVHVPPIDFSVSHFIGVSEYWYSSEHIFGLGGAYDYVQYERAASNFCSRDWKGILKEHEDSRRKHRLGGDGEVLQDGKIVDAGKWGPRVELPRLQMQCFKAAWIANVLHEGIKMPRLIDTGGNDTTDGEKVAEEAEKKGLGRPTFQSVDTVGDIAISWTLGKMVLEASKEVPPRIQTLRPLVDPIDDIEDIEHSPIQPIRPPFLSLVEAKISPHLPSSLTRGSLGFSPVLFLLYICIIFVLLGVAYPMRKRIRASCLRTVRNATKRSDGYGELEEGHLQNGSGPSSPIASNGQWLYPLRRVFSFTHPKSKLPLSVVTANNPVLRHIVPGGNSRSSPTRSFSMPAANGFVASMSTGSTSQYASRSPSPAPGFDDVLANHPSLLPAIPRSRNTSQISLSSMASRGGAISRTSSSHHGKMQAE